MISDYEWQQAYASALEIAELKLGKLTITPTHIRTINTWIRYVVTYGKKPEISGFYFGVNDALPPGNFGTPNSVKDFISRSHEVQGLPQLTQSQGHQIDALSIITYEVCKGAFTTTNHDTPPASVANKITFWDTLKGVIGMLVLLVPIVWIIGVLYMVISRWL